MRVGREKRERRERNRHRVERDHIDTDTERRRRKGVGGTERERQSDRDGERERKIIWSNCMHLCSLFFVCLFFSSGLRHLASHTVITQPLCFFVLFLFFCLIFVFSLSLSSFSFFTWIDPERRTVSPRPPTEYKDCSLTHHNTKVNGALRSMTRCILYPCVRTVYGLLINTSHCINEAPL